MVQGSAGAWAGSSELREGYGACDPRPRPSIRREDLWVRGGRILDPERLFFEERLVADERRDCGGCILAPGFIDVQINGTAQGLGGGDPGRSSEHRANPSFLWLQEDLAWISHRPQRMWVRESPWWPVRSYRMESPPSVPP